MSSGSAAPAVAEQAVFGQFGNKGDTTVHGYPEVKGWLNCSF
jgi:hypothetical protein